MSTPTLADLLARHDRAAVAWHSARRAADFLVGERPADLVVESKSSQTDAVSQMDRGAELRIIETITEAFPDDAILGEEGGGRTGTSGVRWVIDPLDGTVNYLSRLPNWAVSIGVEVGGVVEVGVVSAPALGEAYLGIRGAGAWRIVGTEAEPIAASRASTLGLALVATGYSYDAQRRAQQARQAARLIGSIRDLRRLGAASVDLCWTACGRLDGYYESGLHPWDIAAGALIAREAGCVVRSVEGEDEYRGTLLAAAPGVASALRAAIAAAAVD